ncbi:DUF7010 family protein [Salinicoccus kekensis]|uniref:Uncharacterized protein n=1 Tax=Salinicoccus kekensis TaxID=714307 RepID=A0A285UFQ6_9STAP|nr:hypothetical protein [Salinicoccus kekensis]SOC40642.1 hypothetical protein SAMN05878391_1041 [Salinicoccus kekensis]
MESILKELAQLNQYGVAFLMSFGVTWLICGVFWKVSSANTAGYATLFQGLAALPAALLISYWMGALTERPGSDILTSLVMTIAMSQMLILPLIIVMQAKKHHTLIPFVFSASLTIHFVMYFWLYQTWIYVAMSAVIAAGVAFIYSRAKGEGMPSGRDAARCCFFTGGTLITTGIIFLFL